jgi:hypothetical protein
LKFGGEKTAPKLEELFDKCGTISSGLARDFPD